MSNLFSLEGKVALVTGSTKGIGLGVAERFVEQGARVVISSRRGGDCDAVAAQLNQRAGDKVAVAAPADLSDAAALPGMVEAAAAAWGGLDAVVLNAAKMDVLGTLEQTKPQDFVAMLTANVVNNSILAQAAYPHLMARGGGSVTVIGSIAATGPSPTTSAYSVSKRALLQLVDNLAIAWGAARIRVNAISPGITVSDNTRPLWEPEKVRAGLIAGIPLGRLGEADDIAACALLLASRGGEWITGQNIVIDGGATLRGAGRPAMDFKMELEPT